MKKATLCLTPASVAASCVAGGAAFLLAVHALRVKRWHLSRKEFAPLLFVAIFGYTWPFVIQPTLIERCGSGFIGMMVSFVPLATIVVSIPMLGIYPRPRQLLGVVGGLACLILIMQDGIVDRDISPWDIALAATVPLVYAICNTYIKRRFVGIAPLPLALCCLAIALVLMLPLVAATPSRSGVQPHDWPLAITAVAGLGLLGTGFGAWAFTKLLQDHGPLFAGMVTYLIPTIAIMWAWIDGEYISPKQLIALVGVLAMVALVQYGAATAAPVSIETKQ